MPKVRTKILNKCQKQILLLIKRMAKEHKLSWFEVVELIGGAGLGDDGIDEAATEIVESLGFEQRFRR